MISGNKKAKRNEKHERKQTKIALFLKGRIMKNENLVISKKLRANRTLRTKRLFVFYSSLSFCCFQFKNKIK